MDLGAMLSGLTGGPTSADQIPGSLNQGWDYYFRWADKDHDAWESAFEKAEANRRAEERLWREYYKKVYQSDYGFYKKVVMFALNAIQLWALWKQFRQQKEIADRTYEIANRVQVIAEEMYAFYERIYRPHEDAFNRQINEYFENGCIDYDDPTERFARNTRLSFLRARANMLRCTSSFCGGFTDAQMKQFAIETAQAVGNARNSGYRYAELMKEAKDNLYLDLRMKFIQVGRDISTQGQSGIMKAFQTFNSFGADPGAALNQLLGTLSNTVGSMISSPVSPTGSVDRVDKVNGLPFDVFMHQVKMNGDLQPAKASKTTRSG